MCTRTIELDFFFVQRMRVLHSLDLQIYYDDGKQRRIESVCVHMHANACCFMLELFMRVLCNKCIALHIMKMQMHCIGL